MMHPMTDMFDPKKMAEAFINVAREYTEIAIRTMKTSTEIYEKSLDTLISQGLVAQEEGQKMLADWTNKIKQGQQLYWNALEENLKRVETLLNANSIRKTAKE